MGSHFKGRLWEASQGICVEGTFPPAPERISVGILFFFKTIFFLFLFVLFSFSFFLSFFCLHHVAFRILIPWSGMEPHPGQWKRWVLTTGPPGNSSLFFIFKLKKNFSIRILKAYTWILFFLVSRFQVITIFHKLYFHPVFHKMRETCAVGLIKSPRKKAL